MCAFVVALMVSTAPPTPMLTPPLIAALTPTVAMLSLLVAVTAAPRKLGAVPGAIVRGPVADASADGESPCLTRLCEGPGSGGGGSARGVMGPAAPPQSLASPVAWHLLSASWYELPPAGIT